MLIAFSNPKSSDWPFELVIDLSRLPKAEQTIDGWEFFIDWQKRTGRDVKKLKAKTLDLKCQIVAKKNGVFTISFSGTIEIDDATLNKDIAGLEWASIAYKTPGSKKATLSQKSEFTWGTSGNFSFKKL